MSILNNFEKHQLTRTLVSDFNGCNYPHIFNYLKDLIYFKHVCNCDSCKTLNRDLTKRINKIAVDINLSKIQSIVSNHIGSNIIPLVINQEISCILANFEHFHIKDITLRSLKVTTEKEKL
jgi:hypothetical protein